MEMETTDKYCLTAVTMCMVGTKILVRKAISIADISKRDATNGRKNLEKQTE